MKKNIVCLFFSKQQRWGYHFYFGWCAPLLYVRYFLNLRCTRVGSISPIPFACIDKLCGMEVEKKFHPIIIIKYSLDAKRVHISVFVVVAVVVSSRAFRLPFFYLAYLISVPHSPLWQNIYKHFYFYAAQQPTPHQDTSHFFNISLSYLW